MTTKDNCKAVQGKLSTRLAFFIFGKEVRTCPMKKPIVARNWSVW